MAIRKKILFVAECVTLAHMARPAVLASELDDTLYDIYLASNGRYNTLFPSLSVKLEKLYSISSDHFLEALAKGKPLYDKKTLEKYVEDDLALFERVKPDVVVGDFRLSLSVSARVARVPYVSISNVYWSPYARQRYPVPELPINKLFGVTVAQVIFNVVRPIAFALHTRPLNALRKRFGIYPLGLDLRQTYTDADLTLYADVPGLVQTAPLPQNHRYIGPILWSPEVSLPDWWDQVDVSRAVIYLTPGSSGSADHIPAMAAALSAIPATVMVATAGRRLEQIDTPGVYVSDFLPGEEAVRKADLVVCNGGSPTTGQALAVGKPVVGIPTNLDQCLNMNALANAGVGLMLRSDQITPQKLKTSVEMILQNQQFRQRSEKMQMRIANMRSDQLFRQALIDSLDTETSRQGDGCT